MDMWSTGQYKTEPGRIYLVAWTAHISLTADFGHARPQRAVAPRALLLVNAGKVGPADAIHSRKQQAVTNQPCTRRDGFCLFCSPRVLELIWDHVDQSCRSCLLHSIPQTTFSLLFHLESHLAKRTESINNSISASFMKVKSLPLETPHTTFYNEGKNPKYKSVPLTSSAHETSCLFRMIKFI